MKDHVSAKKQHVTVYIQWSQTEYTTVEVILWQLRSRTTGTWATMHTGTKASTELSDIRLGVSYEIAVRAKTEENGWSELSESQILICEEMLKHAVAALPTCTITALDKKLD